MTTTTDRSAVPLTRGRRSTAPQVRLVPPHEASRYADQIKRLAFEAFSGPPWNETPAHAALLAARFLDDTTRPGFLLAWVEHQAGEPVGFAYGLASWHLAIHAGHTVSPWSHPPFELREIAVAQRFRGQGIGALLHDAVLSATPPRPRWLVTHPAATAALALYRHRGWRAVRLVRGPDSDALRLIMMRPR